MAASASVGRRPKSPLLDTIRLTEENFALAECFEGGDINCPLVSNCDVNSALGEALKAFFAVLESYTIADLAGKRRSLRSRLGLGLEALGLQEAVN